MLKISMKKLSPDAKETLRKQAVSAILDQKMKQHEVVRLFNISRAGLNKWLKLHREQGINGLESKKIGRPKSTGKLQTWQMSQIIWTIIDKCPDQVNLPFTLWNRRAVRQLIKQKFTIKLSLSTTSRLLKKWGLKPNKLIYSTIIKDYVKAPGWLQTEYLMIQNKSKQEKAEIHWGNKIRIRLDPILNIDLNNYNIISSIANNGNIRFMVYKKNLTVTIFIKFLKCLIYQHPRKIFFIIDNLKIHRTIKIQKWIEKNKEHIELFCFPISNLKNDNCHDKLTQNEKKLKISIESYLLDI